MVWDTTPYNDRSLWPSDGSQPFIWSYGDPTGYGTHGDYVFGWKDTSLQQAMDTNCQPGSCAALSEQSIAAGNACSKARTVNEAVDGCKCAVLLFVRTDDTGLDKLPGNNPVTGVNPGAGTGNPGGGTGTNPGTGTGNGGTAAHWDQCGGQDWKGPTVCASGFTCKVSNQWYSQCL